LLLLRTATNLGAAFTFFTGLRFLPLADAFAIAFAAPLFITALSAPMLGERVGPRRWAAVIVGFLGVLVVAQPSSGSFRPEALWPLAAAFFHAVGMLLGRRMTRHMTTSAIMFWPSVGTVLVTMLLMPAQWRTPSLPDATLFCFMGLIGTLGMALITQGYRYAPAAVVAPFDYSTLLWASLFGWILWRDAPGPNVLVGAVILIGSGLYILYRETKRSE
jgi:drug/metabolite transporter (DMT)-like permease